MDDEGCEIQAPEPGGFDHGLDLETAASAA
jgi:hypothetical protein